MAIKPTKPVVPSPPLRSQQQGTFSGLAEAWVQWVASIFTPYLDAIADFVDITADELATNAALPAAQTWQTATAYTVGETVFYNQFVYRCMLDHTSGDFATDLAAGNWLQVGAPAYDINANTLVVVGGVADAYTMAAPSTIQSYYNGLRLRIQINVANNGASTIDVDSIGPVPLEKFNDAGTAVPLEAGDLRVGELFDIGYISNKFILMSQVAREITDQIGIHTDQVDVGTFTVTGVMVNGGTITLSDPFLRYVRHGRIVHVFGRVVVSAVSSPIPPANLVGLPFPAATIGSDTPILPQSVVDVSIGSARTFHCYVIQGGSNLILLDDYTPAAGDYLYFNFSYETDAA